jgi:hypothetical protein
VSSLVTILWALSCFRTATLLEGTQDAPPPQAAATAPTAPLRDFAPGVRIDWRGQQVEVDAKVVLRQGLLELVACSPQTREHESILVSEARPKHICQAMGLVGLEPGSPTRFDEESKRWLAASGEAIELRVRYRKGDDERTAPLEDWVIEVNRDRQPERLPWIFAGSRTSDSGRFAADADGTVICVVDFDSALIALGAAHSADNDQLWLAAATMAIPPVGTPCVLLIRSAVRRKLEVQVSKDGSMRLGGEPISIDAVAKLCERDPADPRPVKLILRWSAHVRDERVASFVEVLVKAGIDRAAIEIEQANPRTLAPDGASNP